MGTVVLDPVTRIDGPLRVDTRVEGERVIDAAVRGEMLRLRDAVGWPRPPGCTGKHPAHAPCVGCARPGFARDLAYAFFRLNEESAPS